MTELAEAPAVERDGAITRIPHWIGGARVEGTSGRSGPVYNPAAGAQSGAVDLASVEEVDTAVRSAPRRSRPGARRRSPSAPSSSSRSESCSTPARGPREAPHRRARQGALGRDGRGRARARGDRVRVRDPDAPQGRLLRAGVDRHRRVLDPPAGRRRRGHHAVQLPRDGAHVDVGPAIACGNCFILKPSEKDPSASLLTAELLKEAGLPDGVFNVVHGDKVAVDAILEHPGHQRGLVRRLDADRAVHLRDRHEARQARAGTRRGEEPHDRAPRRRHRHGRRRGGLGRLRLAGERCMAVSVLVAVGDVADPLVEAIKQRLPKVKVGDGMAPENEMGPLITREHRDKVASYLDSGAEQGATLVADGRETAPDGDGFFLGVSLLDNVTTEMDAYRDEIFGPVLSVVRAEDLRRGSRPRQRQPVRQRRRALHPRRRGRAPVPVRRERGHGRDQRADPGAGGVLLVRRLEGVTVRRLARLRAGVDPLLHARQGRDVALARSVDEQGRPRVPADEEPKEEAACSLRRRCVHNRG